MPVIAFLSDFGTDDVFVGLCHAAMTGRAPGIDIVDLTHGVPPGDVLTGASRLADCVAHTGAAAHLAVVDPGVGTARMPLMLRAGHRGERAHSAWFVGPDNGLLTPAAGRLGGVREAWAITALAGPEVSSTFHGRDVFAPAAAMLADGVAPSELGRRLDPDGLVRLPEPVVEVGRDSLTARVRDIDSFGNVQLFVSADAVGGAVLADRMLVTVGERLTPATRVRTFAELDADELGLLVDAFGWLALVVRDGDAAGRLSLRRGDEVRLERRPR